MSKRKKVSKSKPMTDEQVERIKEIIRKLGIKNRHITDAIISSEKIRAEDLETRIGPRME